MKGRPTIAVYKGEVLKAAEIAKATGLSVQTIRNRIRDGIPLDAPRRPNTGPRLRLEYNGKLMTLREIAQATGLNEKTLSDYHDGKTFYPPKRFSRMTITHEGITDTIAGWAHRLGVSSYLIRNRLRYGWPIRYVLYAPKRRHSRSRLYECKGVALTIPQWARRMSLPTRVLHHRLNTLHWTVEAAVTTPLRNSAQRSRLRKTLARMVEGFDAPSVAVPVDAPSASAVTPPREPTTGGPSKTFEQSPATGPSHKKDVLLEVAP
jgi:predicted DNA-binding transcriptional regulator AlpA